MVCGELMMVVQLTNRCSEPGARTETLNEPLRESPAQHHATATLS
jgi:hypothetical protein